MSEQDLTTAMGVMNWVYPCNNADIDDAETAEYLARAVRVYEAMKYFSKSTGHVHEGHECATCEFEDAAKDPTK